MAHAYIEFMYILTQDTQDLRNVVSKFVIDTMSYVGVEMFFLDKTL